MTNIIPKKFSWILPGIFALSLVIAACNGSSSKKDSGTDTTKKMTTQTSTTDSTKKTDSTLKPQPTDGGSGGGTPQ